MRGKARLAGLIALRDFGADSEISEAFEQQRVPPGGLEIFYRTDLLSISFGTGARRALARFLRRENSKYRQVD